MFCFSWRYFLFEVFFLSTCLHAGPAQRIEEARQAIEQRLDTAARGVRCEAVCVVSSGISATVRKISTEGVDPRLAYELLHTRCVLYNTFAVAHSPESALIFSDAYIPEHGWLFVPDDSRPTGRAVDDQGKAIPASAQRVCKAIPPPQRQRR